MVRLANKWPTMWVISHVCRPLPIAILQLARSTGYISFSRASRPGRNTTPAIYKIYYNLLLFHQGPCGLMDKASASGAGDCGFESHQGRYFFSGAPRRPYIVTFFSSPRTRTIAALQQKAFTNCRLLHKIATAVLKECAG